MEKMSNKYGELVQSFPTFMGHIGSIVRLRIHDFMTYQEVEFKAAPNINLIMGPNGTGKSTVVCAICLALAGKPAILSRATALKEFIRHGCNEATVEVELFNPLSNRKTGGHHGNWVIKRIIRRVKTPTGDGASSEWFMNGSRAKEQQVVDLMKKLHIQLDNLCSFLPQDRVQDFAKQNAVELLKATQGAIGVYQDVNLKNTYEDLKDLQVTVRGLLHQLKRDTENLRTASEKFKVEAKQLEQYREKEKMRKQIRELEGKKLWIRAEEYREINEMLQAKVRNLVSQKKIESDKLKPYNESIAQLEKKLAEYQKELAETTRISDNFFDERIRGYYENKTKDAEAAIAQHKAEYDQGVTLEKNRLRDIDAMKQRLAVKQRDLDEFNEDEPRTDEQMKKEQAQLKAKYDAISKKLYTQEGSNDFDRSEIARRKTQVGKLQAELKEFDKLLHTRLMYLQRNRPDVYKAYMFYKEEENRNEVGFKGDIHEPAILHVNIKDMKYGKIAERHISNDDMCAYFVEDKEDVQKMLDYNAKKGFRVSVIYHQQPHNFQAPKGCLTPQLRKEYDFQLCLIDLIEAPTYYMSYLCKTSTPQRILIGSERTDDLSERVMNECKEIQNFYTEQYQYVIRTSRYSGGKNITITPMADPRIFTQNINAAVKDLKIAEIERHQEEMRKHQKAIDDNESELENIRKAKADITKVLGDLKDKIDARNRLKSQISGSIEYIRRSEDSGCDLEKMKEDYHERVKAAKARLLDHATDLANSIALITPKWHQRAYLEHQIEMLSQGIRANQSEKHEAEAAAKALQMKIADLEPKVGVAYKQFADARKDAVAKTGLREPPADVMDGSIRNSVDRDISSLNAQMKFKNDLSDEWIKDHEERKIRIHNMERQKSELEKTVRASQENINEKQRIWLQPLKELVGKINTHFGTYFENIKCVGEVTLDCPDDPTEYGKYGIKIRVKFRSDEELSELIGTKQSGGERAITTALYILALQALTKVPFRVVDEINQGMDATNESRFFNLLCDLAKGHDTPQYFLLTPKLLPPVSYPDNVEIHMIFNGPWMDKLDDETSDEDSDDDSRSDTSR